MEESKNYHQTNPGAPPALADVHLPPAPVLDDFTVVIPTLGRATLEQCLSSILHGTRWPRQIIIIDQGNESKVADWLACLEAAGIATMHLRAEPRGPGAARNRGFEQVQTRFFAAIDDDCLAETTWLEQMARHLHEHPHAIITGRVNPGGEGFVPSVVTSDEPVTYDRPLLRGSDPFASGNIGMAVATSRLIGPFDEDPLLSAAAEDNELGYRALRRGVPIMYLPDVIIYHMDWRDPTQLIPLYKGYAWGQGVFFGKYLRTWDGFIALRTGIYFFRGVRLWLRGIIGRDYNSYAEGYARCIRFVPGLIAGFRSHSPLQTVEQPINT